MLILAFDTTAAACSVALWRDGVVLHRASETMDQGQAEALVPMIESVMLAAGVAYTDLDRIAVTVGPGSFTGVRVGLATARALGLAAQKPVVGISTTAVLAAAVPAEESAKGRVLVAIDTKRGDVYVQQFASDGTATSDVDAILPGEIGARFGPAHIVVVGDGAVLVAAALNDGNVTLSKTASVPDPAIIARLAAERTPQPGGPLPLYVHPPAVTVPA